MTLFIIISAVSVIGIIFVLVTITKEGKKSDSESNVQDLEKMTLENLVETGRAVPEAGQSEPAAEPGEVKEQQVAEQAASLEREKAADDRDQSDAPLQESEDKFAPETPAPKESSAAKPSFLAKINPFKKKNIVSSKKGKDPSVSDVLRSVEGMPEPEEKPSPAKKKKFSFFSKKEPIEKKDSEPVVPTSILKPAEQESPVASETPDMPEKKETEEGLQATQEKKTASLFSKINIFKKKEKDEQRLASEHYSSLKDFMEKTGDQDGSGKDKAGEVSAEGQEELEPKPEDGKPDQEMSQGEESTGTASLRVGSSGETEEEESEAEPAVSKEQQEEEERPALLHDVIEPEDEDSEEDESAQKKALDDGEAQESQPPEQEAAETKQYSAQGSLEELDAVEEAKEKAAQDESEADSTTEPREPEPVQATEIPGRDEEALMEEYKVLKENYERLDQLLKEKNEDLEEVQQSLNNERQNREEFEGVKSLLEEELLETKTRAKEAQQEKEALAGKISENESMVSDLEEKANALERELLQREEELKSSVEKFESLKTQLAEKDSVINSYLEKMSALKDSQEGPPEENPDEIGEEKPEEAQKETAEQAEQEEQAEMPAKEEGEPPDSEEDYAEEIPGQGQDEAEKGATEGISAQEKEAMIDSIHEKVQEELNALSAQEAAQEGLAEEAGSRDPESAETRDQESEKENEAEKEGGILENDEEITADQKDEDEPDEPHKKIDNSKEQPHISLSPDYQQYVEEDQEKAANAESGDLEQPPASEQAGDDQDSNAAEDKSQSSPVIQYEVDQQEDKYEPEAEPSEQERAQDSQEETNQGGGSGLETFQSDAKASDDYEGSGFESVASENIGGEDAGEIDLSDSAQIEPQPPEAEAAKEEGSEEGEESSEPAPNFGMRLVEDEDDAEGESADDEVEFLTLPEDPVEEEEEDDEDEDEKQN